MKKIKVNVTYPQRVFTDYEIEQLLKNENILGIRYQCEIIYSGNFKLWAVQEKLKYPNKTARQIFEEANFDMSILDERTPQRRLNFWVKKYKKFGAEYFYNLENKYFYKSLIEVNKDNE